MRSCPPLARNQAMFVAAGLSVSSRHSETSPVETGAEGHHRGFAYHLMFMLVDSHVVGRNVVGRARSLSHGALMKVWQFWVVRVGSHGGR